VIYLRWWAHIVSPSAGEEQSGEEAAHECERSPEAQRHQDHDRDDRHGLELRLWRGHRYGAGSQAGPEPNDFDTLFATADPDTPRALDGVHDAANMPLNEEPQRVMADLKYIRKRSDTEAV
jgi:hypothetical protein